MGTGIKVPIFNAGEFFKSVGQRIQSNHESNRFRRKFHESSKLAKLIELWSSVKVTILIITVALITPLTGKVFASRPWKLAQTTGLPKSFKPIYTRRFILNFWLRYGHFKIRPFCIINDNSVIFCNINIFVILIFVNKSSVLCSLVGTTGLNKKNPQ